MPDIAISRLLRPAAAVLAVAAATACGSSTGTTTAGQPAPPASTTVLARGDVLSRDQIDLINAHSMVDLLDGRFAGVRVLRVGGVPRIVIRGFSDPLIVEDGIPLANPSEVWSINPNDVEQIRILRGTDAALYGSLGGRGVIEITTRRGE